MKVMILYANAGNGHRRAAEALASVCADDSRFSDVRLIDALEYTNVIFEELYSKLYIETVKRAPTLWAYAFDETDQPWAKEKARMLLHRLNAQSLVKTIKKFDPDLCLCTHFMPADIISTMLNQGEIHTNLSVVVTDFYVHATWLEPYVHRVYVAKEESREQLIRLDFPEDRVKALGIPVDPLYTFATDRKELFKKHSLQPGLPLVLLSAGAFGVMSGGDMAHMLNDIKTPCNLVVSCGNNVKLQNQISDYLTENPRDHLVCRIIGFTKEIHEWMSMASLYVGKPGGLSTSECLAVGLPMVIWNPIPGQEFFNTIYLLENGAAIAPDNVSTLSFRIDDLLRNPEKLRKMHHAAKALGRPNAARNIVNDAVAHLGEGVVQILRQKSKGLLSR